MKKIIISILFFILLAYSHYALASNLKQGVGLNLMPDKINSEYIQYVKDLNFNYIRTGIPWSKVEKAYGHYDWTEYDKLINNLKFNNINPIIIIGFNNPLYGAKQDFTGISTDKQRKAFCKFALALVSRYKNQNIIWEIWNEPNIGEFWQPSPNPNDYALMAIQTTKAIKSTMPNEQIALPALAKPNSGYFIEVCKKYGLFNYADAVSMHFYKSDGNTVVIPEWLNISSIEKNVTNNINKNKTIPMIVTEMGYSTYWTGIDPYKQGLYLQRELIINRSNQIPVSIIHTLTDLNYNHSEEGQFGLMNKYLEPKPSYFMLKNIAKELENTKFIQRINNKNSNDFIYVFEKNNKKVVFAWTIATPHKVEVLGYTMILNDSVQELSW